MIAGLDKLDPITLAALCVWAESRGESMDGQVAVAWVIRNRLHHPCWWGHDLKSVILTPWQFSWTASSNPEHIDIENLTDLLVFKALVTNVLSGHIPDPVDGATFYFAANMKTWPKWASEYEFVKQLGRHRFYREA